MSRLTGLALSALLTLSGALALPAVAPAQTPAAVVDVQGALADRIMGDPNAPVTIFDFSSMTCPHCATFHATILPELKAKYIDTGKVKLVFRDFPLDGAALLAAALARCAPADRYYPLLDVLFKQQATWARSNDFKKSLIGIGKLAGVPQSMTEACWDNKELINGIIQMRSQGERMFKVDSTPTFFINGPDIKISGAQGVEAFAKAIDPLLK